MRIIVFLYNLRSVYNTASIFRTSDAGSISSNKINKKFETSAQININGVEKIYLCGTTPKPVDKLGFWRKDFTKVSLGAEKNVLWEEIKTLEKTLKLLSDFKKSGYKILAVEQDKTSIPYFRVKKVLKKDGEIILILGNEKNGLPNSILKLADYILEIPMRGKLLKDFDHPKKIKKGKESLNVSVVFGIVLFNLLYG